MSEIGNSTEEYKDYIVHDVLGHIDEVTARKMFGGYGLYLPSDQYGKIMFGGIIEDRLFVRSDNGHCDYLVGEGGEQFIYHGHKTHNKPSVMPWWFVPEHILEDKEKIEMLVFEGFEIARANKQ